MTFPDKGVDLSQGFMMQLAGTTPLGLNVRVYEPLTLRGRGGSRPGISKYIPQQVPGIASLIQHLNIIVDPTTAATLDTFDDTGNTATDPSNDGPPSSWATGFTSRIPQPRRVIRLGGSGRQENKQHRPAQPTRMFIQIFASFGVGLNPNMWAASPVTINPWAGCFSGTPAKPTLTWRIRRFDVNTGAAGPASVPVTQTIMNIADVAHGDAGIQCPTTVPTLQYSAAGTYAFTGWSYAASMLVLETEGFPSGAYKPDPTTFKTTQTCGNVT